MMINFKMVGGDIVFDGQNNITMIDGDDEFLQCVREILTTNTGEWFLDDSNGLDRFSILGEKYNAEEAADMLTEAIFQDDRVERVEKLNIDFDRKSRKMTVLFEIVKTNEEILIGEVEI